MIYGQAELAADSLCSSFCSKSFLSLSLWDLLSRNIDTQKGLIVLKSWILLIKSILITTVLSVFSLYCVPAPLCLSAVSRFAPRFLLL